MLQTDDRILTSVATEEIKAITIGRSPLDAAEPIQGEPPEALIVSSLGIAHFPYS